MTNLLEKAIAQAKQLPEEQQNAIASLILEEIEHYAQQADPEKYITTTLQMNSLYPDAENEKTKIYCYARGDGYQRILGNIRSLLSKKLLDLIN